MWLAVFYIWGSLLAFSVCHICSETSEDAASWVTLKPLGHCGDEENLCPYQLTLPPLSIQLPRPFRELEKMAKELQNLKDMVNQLRRDCQERKDRHSIESGGQKEHSEEKERRHQSPRHNISIKETQSHSGEQVVRILTSSLPQGDTSECEGTVKDGVKRLNHSVLESQEWNIDPRIDLNEGTTDQRSEMSREVKIFNPSLDERPEDISKVKLVLSPTPEETEKEIKSKQSELIELSLPRKKDTIQSSTHGKQQLNILRDGHVKNISGILAARRRVQNVPDANGLSSISRDANTRIMDLSTSDGNRRVVKCPREGGPMRPKGSYINSRVVKVNNEDRLKNPALVRIHNPQARDMMFKIEPEEAGFSPARSGIMRVKETSPLIANTKTGVITGPTLSTDDQNNQDISRVSGPRTDDGHGLKDANASQVTNVREDNLRKVNKTGITRLPTNLRKENQGDVSHIATNKSISNVMNQGIVPNMFKEEKQYVGLSESLVVISSEAEISSNVDREDLTFLGRQVENEKYLNPITKTNNRKIDSTILDKADSTFNERTLPPDLKDQMQPGMFSEGANEHIGFNSLSAGTMKKDIPIHSKAILPEKDLVKPTLVPTVKSKSTESTVSTTSSVQSLVVGQGTRRISITPLKAAAVEGPSQNSKKNISKIREVSQDNKRYVMPNPDRHPIRHPTTVISSRVNNLRQSNVMGNMSANRSVGVHSKLSIPVRNSNTTRKNGYGIIRPSYISKPNFQSQPNRTRGFKTKANTVTQFSSPTGATEQVQTEEIKHIPQVMRSNVLDNKWLKNNSTESKSQQSQNSGDVQGLEKVQQRNNQVRDNSEPVLITNIGSAEDPNTLQSGASNSPTGGKESKIFSLGTDDTSNQHPFEVDKISSGKKGPTAPTLKKELSKEPGKTLSTTTVSFMDTDHEDSTKNILKMTKTHVEMVKNVSWETPISFENTGTTRELELIKLNKDRVEENSGEILSNPNSADIAQGYSGERYTIPVVLETLTNVEEIKGSKLFSLGPEDAAEGFKSHAVSDEVTEREQVENKIHSICDSDCNTTSTQQSTTLTRAPVDSGREKGPAQDCADYITKSRRNGVYRVTPQPKSSMLPVFCDMESSGGGWTLIQHRFDGSTSFNRTWDEYKNGFGKLIGEFWLGNDKIHLLTKAKNMSLRIEIEDFEGIREYAHYDHFYVANESQQYRLSIGGYSGTAGNAMQFSKKYNHDQKLFTTPDRDNDQYPSGNCGAYYSSGWWFDACMSANLNGRYYQSKYKGVRNGIFWGTWHNITMEYYPTNDRQSFKTVKMMIRPKNYAI
ncbi:uncharacterized protein LOC107696253 [Sinocyclocheilus anshuiensis]|uniref:uncharacterized protein LOC107696253 n=1 Tax=Sinocyclocheilus anshuiensis TaxID=1608454 RepID=UPI0007B92DAB|nr:PREDICTED: uncharacterized protein LOC107696253 [Sinocyclocheilus anshuiensis]